MNYCSELKAQPAGPHALHTESTQVMQWHLGHQSLPFCLPRLITVHAVQCRWLMTCSLTLKVLWPLNTLRAEMHPHFFYAGKTLASLTQLIFLPTRNNSEQRMTILVSLVKRHRSWVFISLLLLPWRVTIHYGPRWRELKMSPQPWTILLCQEVPCEGKHMGSNALRVQEES